ncbi:MAG TPA: RecQ family zinc-binding domain-containing protein, partial [Agriterribacter sp.]|nr:RecQ family zinc-binding domain-containing protein [Agriterribacter sp.]
GYAGNTTNCRAQVIANYFNDSAAKACGICDNCLENKKNALAQKDFSALRSAITKALFQGPLTMHELMNQLDIIDEKKVWRVVEHLLSEKYLEMSEMGFGGKLSIKKKGQDRNPARF